MSRPAGSVITREPPEFEGLRIALTDVVTSEHLGALVTAAAAFYRLHRELAEREARATSSPFSHILTHIHIAEIDLLPDLIIRRLEIGTPNFIEWLGRSKSLKSLERVLQAAAAVAAITGYTLTNIGGHPDTPPIPPLPPIVIIHEPRPDPSQCLHRFDEALNEELRLHELYMSSKITFEEYRKYTAEVNTIKDQMLKGCKVVKPNGQEPR